MFKNSHHKISKLFNLWKRKNISPDQITPAHAKEIQKESYKQELLNDNNRRYTPPFLEIAKQLADPKDEIFEAAVFYLCQIAKNNPKQAPKIFEIFDTFLSSSENPIERKEIIKTKCKPYNRI